MSKDSGGGTKGFKSPGIGTSNSLELVNRTETLFECISSDIFVLGIIYAQLLTGKVK
jgi:hypothetical protein